MSTFTELQLEQLRGFSDCIVMHPIIKEIFNDFDELRENRYFQSDQQCMLLTGDTGVGKTHLIKHYIKRVSMTQNSATNTIPVLVTRISSGKGLDATLIQLLQDSELFGSSQRKRRGYKTDLRKKVVETLIKAKVELLIIREFQELIEFKGVKERQDIANGLKYISEEAKVPIVLVGMPWAERIADEPQWSSRIVRKRKLEYFSIKNNPKYFRKYLMGLAKHMPFDTPPQLEDKHTTVALFAVCRGENRALRHFLTEALKIAIAANEDLENKHFSLTFNKIYCSNTKLPKHAKQQVENPFEQDIKDIKVYEVSKSSSYNPNAIDPEHMLMKREFSLVN